MTNERALKLGYYRAAKNDAEHLSRGIDNVIALLLNLDSPMIHLNVADEQIMYRQKSLVMNIENAQDDKKTK